MRIVIAAALFAVLLVLPLLAPKFENHSRLQEYRTTQSEHTASSESGQTRYKTWGNKNNPAVLLIHSFNGYLESWEPNIKPLADAGYFVIAYDLFGRGLSDRPLKPYTPALFREQIRALRKELELTKPMFLIGASFGSVIAEDYAVTEPDQVRAIVMTGPAGWPNPDDKIQRLVNLPVLGDIVFYYAGAPILQSKIRSYLLTFDDNEWATAYWKVYGQFPGVERAALSTLRNSPVMDNTKGWRKLGAQNTPVLILWGRQDNSFPYSHSKRAQQLLPNAEINGIDSAAHWVNVDQPEEVNRAIQAFLLSQR